MPPRFAYWTILIDNTPTAFRARDREELLPTFAQLKRKSEDVVIKWFAQGRLWDSPEAQRAVGRKPAYTGEKRGNDWRPGGTHKDPRDRFKKKNRPERAWSEGDGAPPRSPRSDSAAGSRPWRDKPAGPARGDRPWSGKPAGAPARNDRPWQTKPTGPRSERKPWSGKPPAGDKRPWSGKPRGDRPWSSKPPTGEKRPWSAKPREQSGGAKPFNPAGERERKPWSKKPPAGAPRSDRPWRDKPAGPPRGDRPWSTKPPSGDRRPWSGKPTGDRSRGGSPAARERKPWQKKPFRPGGAPTPNASNAAPRKRRDDEPPDHD
jgi:23S rRNA pseudouridine2605 synthase